MSGNYSLDQYRTDQEKLLKKQQEEAKQRANASHQKLLKYLPQRTAGQSVGMTESAEIAANNAYLKDLSAADSAYTEGIGKLNNYLRAEAESEQNEAFQNAMTTIDSGTFNTAKELEDYLNGYKDRVSDIHWQELQGRLNYYKNNPEQQSADEEYEKQKTLVVSAGKAEDVGGYLSNTDEGNNFKIGGHKVELGTAAVQDAVPADKAAKIADMVPFAYNGSIYIKINGTVYTVRGRGGKTDSDGYRNALAYLTGEKSDGDTKVRTTGKRLDTLLRYQPAGS